jgi:uncharacterized repeat protein (TIGR03943 family)
MVAAVTRQTQAMLLAFLGAVLLRMSLSDAYLRYVTEWMKWPILASGVILLGLAVGPLFGDPGKTRDTEHSDDDTDHSVGSHSGVPKATWLLVLPGLVVFVISPPELGSFMAERRANQSVTQPKTVEELSGDETNEVLLQEFVWRAQSGGDTLVDRPVSLTGFASHEGEDWFVTRLTIGCCAADALAFRVRVDGADRPARDQWVRVTGTYVEGTGESLSEDPVIDADDVTEIEKPRQTYE